MSLNIAVIYGSTREGRLGIRFAKYLNNEFSKRGNNCKLIDPIDIKLDTLVKRYADYDKDKSPEQLESLHKTLDNSDAFIIVSGEYNHFIPPALVNLLNHFYIEYQRKPSAVATYSVSPFGGVRVSSPLRAFLAQLGMPPISSMLHAPFISKNFNTEGKRISDDIEERQKEFEKFATELEWYGNALKKARNL
tara:strand:+ start:4683 stop:5258 length:576 start_codon:yes stop_codon:yes gene_type:complete